MHSRPIKTKGRNMTKTNEELREKVKEIELAAVQCLNSQPHDDRDCKRHLLKCLSKMADMAGDFRGLVEVEAYDIKWDKDEDDVDLPASVRLMMDSSDHIGNEIADKLSCEFGSCVKRCEWRVM